MSKEIPIWRVKYLPNTIEQICGREELKGRLNNFIKSNNFPHLLFVGPEGIGKTTIARLFSKAFLGDLFNPNFRIVYADIPLTSEERKQARTEAYVSTSKIGSLAGRTITTPAFLQVKIKPFIQLKVLGGAPFKILIIKNFEALGSNQQGFRRLMESYGTNCRMILITTNISSVIDPIISRCQLLIISPVNYTSFKNLILDIANNESLIVENETIELLYRISEGKISNAIDLLQLSSINTKSVDLNRLYDNLISSQNELIRNLLLLSFKGDFSKARELSRNIQANYRYSPHEIFELLLNELLKLPLSIFSKCKLIDLIANADFRAIDGLDSDIQVSNLIAKICYFSEFIR
ncbi:MAG: AAA family ATPase [Candidatus Hermodarchaeota archaeon]